MTAGWEQVGGAVEVSAWRLTRPHGGHPAGTIVYACDRPTYGCIDWGREIAATLEIDGGYPFFEVPRDAVEPA